MKHEFGSELVYHYVDVTNEKAPETVVADIAAERQRLDGRIAAAATQQVTLSVVTLPHGPCWGQDTGT
ncbi:hypothetical protein PMIN02_011006 [Paraphaeosphaeria minitans]